MNAEKRTTTLSIEGNIFHLLTVYSGLMSVERNARVTVSDIVNEALDEYFKERKFSLEDCQVIFKRR